MSYPEDGIRILILCFFIISKSLDKYDLLSISGNNSQASDI